MFTYTIERNALGWQWTCTCGADGLSTLSVFAAERAAETHFHHDPRRAAPFPYADLAAVMREQTAPPTGEDLVQTYIERSAIYAVIRGLETLAARQDAGEAG